MKLFKNKNHPLIPVLNEWKKLNKMESRTLDSIDEEPILKTFKIDGELTAVYYNNGDVELVSKTGTIRKELPLCEEIKDALKEYKEVILIGELYGVDENGKMLPFNETSSILRTPTSEEEKRIRLSVIQILSADKLFFDSVIESYSLVKELFSEYTYIHPMPEVTKDLNDIWTVEIATKNYEGFVLYYPDKIVKVKPKLEFDLAVIFVEISDIHPDRMGALGLAFMDEERNFRYAGKAGTGFSNKDRYDWLEYGKEREVRKEDNKIFIKPDRVVKIEAMDVFIREAETYDQDLNYIGDKTSGILRQPVFIEIREDKEATPEDIRIEQIPNWNKLVKTSSLSVVSYIQYIKNHKNSKGEPAPWVIKEHNTGRILSSHKTKEEAEKHLKQIYYFRHKKAGYQMELDDYLKERLFEKYLNDHINSVKDNVKKIVFKYPQYIKALENVEEHDKLKNLEPERTPYIELTYKKLYGIKDLSEEEQQALFHHIKNSKHHPEYWDDLVQNVRNDPDNATQEVNVSKMPDEYLLEMVADWKATADVLGNTARSWFEKQNGKRWIFTSHQIDLINKFIDVLEPQESNEERNLIQSVEEEIKAVKLYTDFRDKTNDEKVKDVYNHVIDEEMEHAEEFLDALKNTREALFMNAYFPSHPDKIVIPEAKKTEKDIWNYYDSIKEKMLNYLKGYDIVLRIITDSGPIIVRHDPKTGENIKINTIEDFDRWNNGRVIEFHRAIPSSKTDLLWIDFDPHEEYDKKDIFKIMSEIEEQVKDNFDVNKIETFSTGGRGYHMFIYLKSEIDVDEARKELKRLLDEISENHEKITTGIANKDEMRLDISTLHYGGSLRSPFSLNITSGIPEKPINITISHLLSFIKTGDQDEIIKTEYGILRELSDEGLINNDILGKLLEKTDFGKRMREETERKINNEISKEEYKNNIIKLVEELLAALI